MSRKAWEREQFGETVKQFMEYCEGIGDLKTLEILRQFEEAEKPLFFAHLYFQNIQTN